MAVTRTDEQRRELSRRVADRVAELGVELGDRMGELTGLLHKGLADAIEPLQGDRSLLDLLYASIESNLETLVHIMRYEIPVEEVSSPSAAEEYARRLAQRGISSTALIRAYRLGQSMMVEWAFDELDRREPDPAVALAAGRQFAAMTFRYIDSISEQVVEEYESERERWLSNRNTVRAAMVDELLQGEPPDLAAAEQALGYRLRQQHLGVTLWSVDQKSTAADLHRLEKFLSDIARAAGSDAQPLFLPRDRSTAWGWIGLGRSARSPDLALGEAELERGGKDLYAAFGSPAAGAAGFRITQLEAAMARQVALVAGDRALRLTSFTDPEVRTAAMLAVDPEAARRLVATALGSLAADTEGAERSRETLRVFLTEKGSYVATAERLHLHKNTVKYRVDKAVEERGRPLDEERLELELALVACRQLGAAVLG